MGINDEYSRDAYLGDHYAYDSDESDDVELEIDPEEWEIRYSEEIHDGWATFQGYIHDNYLTIKDNCTISKFIELLIEPTKFRPTFNPSQYAFVAWNYIKRVSLVKERVPPENFYTWFHIYVNHV
jgi:hypothetical protein